MNPAKLTGAGPDEKFRMVVRRDGNGPGILAVVDESGIGTGRIRVKLFNEGRNASEIDPPRYQMELTTLEALELSLGLEAIREKELERQTGRAALETGRLGLDAFEKKIEGTPDYDAWMAGIRKKTLEWMGRTQDQVLFCSNALALACCGIPADINIHPMNAHGMASCLSYLEYVPEARERMHAAARLNDEWARVVAAWGKLEELAAREDMDGLQKELDRISRGNG